MPPRFFCHELSDAILSADAAGDAAAAEVFCTLGPDETRHARKVLRLSEGDTVELFNGTGGLANAVLVEFVKNRDGLAAVCRVSETRVAPEPTPRLTVAAAVPKGPRAEAMVNQLGQLGADVFVPLHCERSAVDPGGGKIQRYEKAAIASAKQSGRPWLMRIEPRSDLAAILRRSKNVGLILHPQGVADPGLPVKLREAQDVLLLIGPEGGWTDAELVAAEAAGFARWCINTNVLRIETAAAAAVSVLRYLTMP